MMAEMVSPSVQVETLRVHHLADRLVKRGSAALGKRTHNVAFGQNAGDAVVDAEDERCADPIVGKKRDRGLKRSVGFDSDDVATLGGQNNADGHRSLPLCLSRSRAGWSNWRRLRPDLTSLARIKPSIGAGNGINVLSLCTVPLLHAHKCAAMQHRLRNFRRSVPYRVRCAGARDRRN
jgi:hypothetical protein